jgi:mono/diheme cytochrome c family protein
MFIKDADTLIKGVALTALLQFAVFAQPPANPAEKLFSDYVQPVLQKSCLPCHSPQTKSAGLDLSTRDGLLHGGEHGPAMVPGDPKASLIYKLVAHEADPHMPLKADKLPQESIDRIAEWIKAGAPFEQAGNAELASFRNTVKPLLEANCVKCHNSQLKRSGFDLSTREALLRGGDTGPVVTPGDAKSSVLYKRIAHLEQPGMPFGGQKLPDADIAQIADWINAGAPYDAPLAAGKAALNHWAFKMPQRPPVPEVKNRAWVRNPIDAFVAAEQEKRSLKPLPSADRRTVLRRVYLDLVGLPPTPAEMNAFLADNSKDAYEKVVDTLLASPRYGERWGRHWMDIWRYSDWYGWRAQNQVRYSQRHIWHWRDWIIESVNKDKGYDEMIVEMLAGDELAPNNPDVTRATGYLARNWYMFDRNVWLKDTVDYTAMAFLGLTVKCARCHSHKYDPITHEDYYRLRAFFEPYDVRTDRVPGQADLKKDGIPRVYDAHAETPTYRFVRGADSSPDTEHPLTPAIPAFFGNAELKMTPEPLPLDVYYPDSRPFVHRDLIAAAKGDIEKSETELRKAQEELDKAKQQLSQPAAPAPVVAGAGNRSAPAAPSDDKALDAIIKAQAAVALRQRELASARAALPALEARIAADEAKYSTKPPANLEELESAAMKSERHANVLKAEENLLRAQQELAAAKPESETYDKEAVKKLGEARAQLEAAAKALESQDAYTPVGKIYPDSSTGRRLALARWIANKQNPLTARVAINHMWLRHFGQALVPTVFNFGISGKTPSHPELLDWLAMELMDRNWSMKSIHRLIVTSNTYRMQSSTKDAISPNAKIDPDNRYLWRMNEQRMQSEVVRDSLLSIAGQLDTAMGGLEIEAEKGLESHRRSVYFQHTPDVQVTFLKVFDEANPNECFQRNESIVPHQALALANSKLSLYVARTLERQLTKQTGETAAVDSKFIAEAFDVILNRPPSAAERSESLKFLVQQDALFQDPKKLTLVATGAAGEIKPESDPHLRARENLVHVLLNHTDFVTIR